MNCRRTLPSLLVLALALAACSGGSTSATPRASASPSAAVTTAAPKYADEPTAGTASAPCGTKTKADPPVADNLPKGFPVVAGWTPTSMVKQGTTVAVHGVVKGLPTAIVAVRDAAFAKITKAGYHKTGSDQEPGFEADGDFSPRGGNINVKTLCKDYLVVTYTFSE